MNPQGTYVLFMRFRNASDIEVGALGTCHFEPGIYCYVGSAMGGLDQRVGRHLSHEKAMRWHIDRLTVAADEMEAYESYPDFVPECELGRMAESCGGVPAVDGFGCSDCHCRTHLFKINAGSAEALVDKAGLRHF